MLSQNKLILGLFNLRGIPYCILHELNMIISVQLRHKSINIFAYNLAFRVPEYIAKAHANCENLSNFVYLSGCNDNWVSLSGKANWIISAFVLLLFNDISLLDFLHQLFGRVFVIQHISQVLSVHFNSFWRIGIKLLHFAPMLINY